MGFSPARAVDEPARRTADDREAVSESFADLDDAADEGAQQ